MSSYTIRISDDGLYLVITVKGDITVEFAKQFSIESINKAKKNNIIRLLFDVVESRNIDSSNQNYSFVYDNLLKINPDKSDKRAILVSPGDETHSFIEMVMRNAGYNARIFIDRQTAIDWLLDDIDDSA